MKAKIEGFNPDYSEQEPTLADVLHLTGYAVLEFGAPWCGHCRAASGPVQEILAKLNLPHIKVFDGSGKPLGRHFKVKLWPTLILLDTGREVERVVRPVSVSDLQAFTSRIQTKT